MNLRKDHYCFSTYFVCEQQTPTSVTGELSFCVGGVELTHHYSYLYFCIIFGIQKRKDAKIPLNYDKKNPERWITWLVGRRRTQQTARHCVKCRSHEHRHVERTLLARNPGVSGHVHPRVGIDSNINQYELGPTLSRAPHSTCVCGRDSSRPSVLPAFAGSACMGVLRRLLSLSLPRGGGQSTASPEIFRPRDAKHFASCVFERKKRVLA